MSVEESRELLDILFGELDEGEYAYTGSKWEHLPELLNGDRANRSSLDLYTNTSTFALDESGQLSRQDRKAVAMYCVVLDDIGSKRESIPALAPTAIIETSLDNFQYVYALDPPLDIEDARMLCARMVAAGSDLGDVGAMKMNQLIRIPLGRNTKKGRDRFEVRLELLEARYWSADRLISEWDLPEASVRQDLAPTGGDWSGIDDPLMDWLISQARVIEGGDTSKFYRVLCPGNHSEGGDLWGGYSPLGHGALPDKRVYSCFHEGCQAEHPAPQGGWFIREMVDRGAPLVDTADPAAILVKQWALVGGTDAYDMDATAATRIASLKLAAFMASNAEEIAIGRRFLTHGQLWKKHPKLLRCMGGVYAPGEGRVLTEKGALYINTYRSISWPRGGADISVYLSHVARLIPIVAEQEIFHQWIAWKLQTPWDRSYAIVMVSRAYGTGRSSLGRVLTALWQAGVRKPRLEDICGKGTSQAVYNSWIADSQLIISEETKSGVSSWREDHDMYEDLKYLVDTGVNEAIEIKTKYGLDSVAAAYCNFLFFTNHTDALQLPADDRRFCVLDNTSEMIGDDDAAAIKAFGKDGNALAALYWHYMDMDVSGFVHFRPPSTPAKLRMIEQSRTTLQVVMEDVLEDMPGSIVSRSQLILRFDNALLKLNDEMLERRSRPYVVNYFKRMEDFSTGHRMMHKGEKVTPKVVREDKNLSREFLSRGNDVLREILSLNDPEISNIKGI